MASSRTLNISSRWVAPLFLANMAFYLVETITGFALFFLAGLSFELGLFSKIHVQGGLVMIPIYLCFQIPHYFRVKHLSSHFHYKLGIASAVTLLVVILSGIPLIENFNISLSNPKLVTLIHVVSSFAFLICLTGHLVVVWRMTIGRLRT